MIQKPLLLANEWLLGLAQDADVEVALVATEAKWLPQFKLPSTVEVLDRRQALNGLRAGQFSCLVMTPRKGPLWDDARSWISNAWQMRKKMRDDSLLRQYQIPKLAISLGVPLGVVDRSDNFHIAEWDHPLLRAARVYWMRERQIHPHHSIFNTSRRLRRYSSVSTSPLLKDLDKVRSISLGISDSRLPLIKPAPKRYDIFFAGIDSSPTREHARQVLRRLEVEGKYTICLPEEQIPREEFYRACAESYLVVSPSGWGWDCYRHYEAALCESVPVMNYPTIRRYHPLVEGVHGLYYDLEEDGLELCLARALSDKAKLVEMGRRGREHVLRHHLFSKLLRRILDVSGVEGE